MKILLPIGRNYKTTIRFSDIFLFNIKKNTFALIVHINIYIKLYKELVYHSDGVTSIKENNAHI